MNQTTTAPQTAEDQVRFQKIEKLLDTFRPIFQEEGGDAHVLEVKDGVARVAIAGGCEGCGSWFASMEGGLRTTIQERVEGIRDVVFE